MGLDLQPLSSLTTQLWKHTQMFILKALKNSSHSIITLAHSLRYRNQHQPKMERIRQLCTSLYENKIPSKSRLILKILGEDQLNLQSCALEKKCYKLCILTRFSLKRYFVSSYEKGAVRGAVFKD